MTHSTAIIDQLHRHRSVRRYLSDPVPAELVAATVAAGQSAATSSNLQLYSAVAVTEQGTRYRLAELCGDQDHIRQAPVFIAWCADLSRLERVCRARGYDVESGYLENFLVAAIDTALLMQNAVLAAESLGLGTCYIGAIRNRPAEVIETLELPLLTFPIAGMTLGWPAGEGSTRPRLATEAVLHWERYDPTSEGPLLERYDEAMKATGIYRGRQVATAESEGEVDDYGWLEHSARRVSKRVRVGLRQVVEEQGFGLK